MIFPASVVVGLMVLSLLLILISFVMAKEGALKLTIIGLLLCALSVTSGLMRDRELEKKSKEIGKPHIERPSEKYLNRA